MKKLCNLFV